MTEKDPPDGKPAPGPEWIAGMLHDKGVIPDPKDPKLLKALAEMTPEELARARQISKDTPGADPFLVSLILKALADV
jgi:hypothetical protein